jgi:hypothetical protein
MWEINELTEEVHENAVKQGWWEEKKSFGDIIALCHTELSEAFEEHRNGHKPTEIYFHCTLDGVSEDDECDDINKDCYFREGNGDICVKAKPEGIPIELADCIIRILDYCGHEGIDIDHAIKIKHEYNKTRPYKHGNKAL